MVVSENRVTDLRGFLDAFVEKFGAKNPDGWGVALLDESTGLYRVKKVYHRDIKLLEGVFLRDVGEVETRTLIVHLRKASIGRKCLENCHPFENYIDDHQFVFAHNGTVWPRRALQSKLVSHKPRSSDPTDSELIFCYILDMLENNGVNLNSWRDVAEALNEIVLRIRSEALLTKLNFVLADRNYVYCYNWNELRYTTIPDNWGSHGKQQNIDTKSRKIVVCSKPLFENHSWEPLPPKTLVVIHGAEILSIRV